LTSDPTLSLERWSNSVADLRWQAQFSAEGAPQLPCLFPQHALSLFVRRYSLRWIHSTEGTSMKIQEKELDDIIVLALDGSLLGEPETSEVRECVYRALKGGKRKVVLDLSKVTKINSSGLGTLMSVLSSIRKKKGELRLANITEHVGALLALTKLIKVLKTYESVERAVKAF
jgi:anti-sigma B factor antagonist